MKKTISQITLVSLALVLMGQGCFGGEGKLPDDGALWQTTDAGADWTHLAALPSASGVGSIGGTNVTALEIDPSDRTAYYLGSEQNGMFYSLDSGNSWQRPEDDEARSGYIIDVEVDPRDTCTVYVMKPSRILKTVDCNRNYDSVYVETRSNTTLTSMVIDWYNPDRLWAANSQGELILSEDAGDTWQTVERIGDSVTDMIMSHRDSRIIIAGTEKHGIYRTTDGGQEWLLIDDELDEQFEDGNRVYGFTQTYDGQTMIMNTKFGLLRSIDQGANWVEVPLITDAGEVRIWSVALGIEDDNEIFYATGEILYHSLNAGDAWETQELPSVRAPKVMQLHPTDTDRLLVGFAAVAE